MEETRFHTLADQTLEALADAIDEALGDQIDVELDHGILNITLKNRGQYVINKHGPMRQIWMSSPVSGASHFEFHEPALWISTRNPGMELVKTLLDEINSAHGTRISLG